MAMVSPDVLARQVLGQQQQQAGSGAMSREGTAPSLGIPRRGQFVMVVAAVVTMYFGLGYLRKGSDSAPGPAAAVASVAPSPVPAPPPSTQAVTESRASVGAFRGMGAGNKSEPFSLLWVRSGWCGAKIDGAEYEMPVGDRVGDYVVRVLGERWADVEIGGKQTRFYIAAPRASSGNAGVRGGAAPAGGGGASKNGASGLFPARRNTGGSDGVGGSDNAGNRPY